jgi:subtilisin family serine protease
MQSREITLAEAVFNLPNGTREPVSLTLQQMAEVMAPTEIIPVIVKTNPNAFQNVNTKVSTYGIDGATKRFATLFNNIQDFFPPLSIPALAAAIPGVAGFNIGLPPPPTFPPQPFARINIPEFNIFNLALVRKDLDTLQSIEGVKKVYYDAPMKISEAAPAPTGPDKRGWLLPQTIYDAYGLAAADKQGFTGQNVVVAVLDTGWQPTPSLPFVESYAALPFLPGVDENGHGSWCAHWIGGRALNTSVGRLGGLSPAVKLVCIKVLGFGIGTGTTAGILMGMKMAIARGARIVSMSLGGPGQKDAENPYTEIIESTKDKILWVIAAGNDGLKGQGTIGTPGSVSGAITVGAMSYLDKARSYFSSLGPSPDGYNKPDCYGFGGGRARVPDTKAGGYDEYLMEFTSFMSLLDGAIDVVPDGITPLSGTSMATPGVVALLARAVQKYPELTTDQVKMRLPPKPAPSDMPISWSMFEG